MPMPLFRTDDNWQYQPDCPCDHCLDITNNSPQILYQREQFISHNNLDIVPCNNQPQHQLSYLNNQQSHLVNITHTQPVISQQQLIHPVNMTHTQPVINQQQHQLRFPIQPHVINGPITNQVQYQQQSSSQPPPSPVQANIHINNHHQPSVMSLDQPICQICNLLNKHHHHDQQEQRKEN
ncbi:450_t:CDS:2 [Racocetra fulgida]|uniref:450_t:CDS:1 n=1 Tax=Racocetra fulgida TaxID=60492 RepID=A0A9N9DFZ4_9GLOM|nr:450_t:CDS:2 [Racocetra fulgida]